MFWLVCDVGVIRTIGVASAVGSGVFVCELWWVFCSQTSERAF